MGHWTEQGFVSNPLSYYKSTIQQVFVDAFGEDFDLDDNLPQGVLIQRLAELFYGMDMDGIEAFSRLNLNSLAGLFADVVGNWRGIPRILGAPQKGVITITCDAGTFQPFTLPEGTVFTVTETNDTFIASSLTTVSTPEVSIPVEYTQNGNSSAIIGNTMTVEGYPLIKNIEIISLFDGTENESDLSYRTRIQKEYPAATSTLEWVTNLLRRVSGMRDVSCLYNDTNETVGDLPAYSTEWIVAPTNSVAEDALPVFKADVASIILNNKVPGSPTYGNTTELSTDAFGTLKSVSFSMAEEVPMMIEVTVGTPETTGVLNLSNIEDIKLAVVDYVNNLGIKMDVSYSRAVSPFAADTGFDVVSFKMKAVEDADWVTNANYFIGAKQYATITTDNITVSV